MTCPKCGAPQGLIGYMCSCWYDYAQMVKDYQEYKKWKEQEKQQKSNKGVQQ